MNTTSNTPPILHDKASTEVSNKTSNVNDCEAISDPAGLMPTPPHNPLLINASLKALDPSAERFTLQLFRDPRHRKNENRPHGLRLIQHCTADETVVLARNWNTPEHAYGIFATINETDLAGRTSGNIIRARAVYMDADEDLKEVISRLKGLLKPSAIIKSSRGRAQFYWWVDYSFPLDQFSRVQRALIAKFGTDAQIHDLPRVMRLQEYVCI